jgi:hypothetical protein
VANLPPSARATELPRRPDAQVVEQQLAACHPGRDLGGSRPKRNSFTAPHSPASMWPKPNQHSPADGMTWPIASDTAPHRWRIPVWDSSGAPHHDGIRPPL